MSNVNDEPECRCPRCPHTMPEGWVEFRIRQNDHVVNKPMEWAGIVLFPGPACGPIMLGDDNPFDLNFDIMGSKLQRDLMAMRLRYWADQLEQDPPVS